MNLDAKDLIEGYFETIKEKYPDFDRVNEVCRYPFKFVKEKMTEGKFRDIRLKYFGVFKVYPSYIVDLWHLTNTLQHLTDEDREKKRKRILDYVQENKDKFRKYKNFTEEVELYVQRKNDDENCS